MVKDVEKARKDTLAGIYAKLAILQSNDADEKLELFRDMQQNFEILDNFCYNVQKTIGQKEADTVFSKIIENLDKNEDDQNEAFIKLRKCIFNAVDNASDIASKIFSIIRRVRNKKDIDDKFVSETFLGIVESYYKLLTDMELLVDIVEQAKDKEDIEGIKYFNSKLDECNENFDKMEDVVKKSDIAIPNLLKKYFMILELGL